ncbi:toll/interleukin-1 receptor domain-containing protein [Ideonella sp. 4Y16]|uniref:toll/interleukin-1 receptor domain-containing protein n=1 Tax=Ideonella alba TaxID=2824118 RepID=UPI001B39653E|nr:toll/interleukin-1 receptor domain-containing protein [Ideonella alba]MBQ0942932.1 toll/interleukin-1 receptor domain-containing protein [Ideonella alba]
MPEPHIFISYRRADSEHAALRVHERLQARFGGDAVFIDRELPSGIDWDARLHERVHEATAVVVLVGPRFIELFAEHGPDEPDVMLAEIREALDSGKRVFPLVVGAPDMPPASQLPASIRRLAQQNARFAPAQYFDTAMEMLERDIAAAHGWVAPDSGEAAERGGLPTWARVSLLLAGVSASVALASAALAWLAPAMEGASAARQVWHGLHYLLATLLFGLGPYLSYWVVAELRARAGLPVFSLQGWLSVLIVGGNLVLGGAFLLLTSVPGWQMRPWWPGTRLAPAEGDALYYATLAGTLLAIALGTVALALWEPVLRRAERHHGTQAQWRLSASSALLLLALLWFGGSLVNSVPDLDAATSLSVVGYIALCPTLSLLMVAWQATKAQLGLGRDAWQVRGLFWLLGALYVLCTLSLFATGPLQQVWAIIPGYLN